SPHSRAWAASSSNCPHSGWNGWVTRKRGVASPALSAFACGFHEHPGNVLGIVEVAHGGKGDDNHAVVVIVAALHFMLINTHDLEAHSVDANALAFGLFTGEQASFCFVANHRHPCMFDLVRLAQGASSSDVKTTDSLIHRIDAGAEQIRESACVVLDGHALLVENRGHSLDHGHFVPDVLDIRELEPDLSPSLGATGLQRSAPGEDTDYVRAPGTEDHINGALESRAEGQQDYDRCNTPRHPQPGQRPSPPVVLPCTV